MTEDVVIKFNTEKYCYDKLGSTSLTSDQKQIVEAFIKEVENSEIFKEYQALNAKLDDLIKNSCLKMTCAAMVPFALLTAFWGCYPCRLFSIVGKYHRKQTEYLESLVKIGKPYSDKLKQTGYCISLVAFNSNPSGTQIRINKVPLICLQWHIVIKNQIADIQAIGNVLNAMQQAGQLQQMAGGQQFANMMNQNQMVANMMNQQMAGGQQFANMMNQNQMAANMMNQQMADQQAADFKNFYQQ